MWIENKVTYWKVYSYRHWVYFIFFLFCSHSHFIWRKRVFFILYKINWIILKLFCENVWGQRRFFEPLRGSGRRVHLLLENDSGSSKQRLPDRRTGWNLVKNKINFEGSWKFSWNLRFKIKWILKETVKAEEIWIWWQNWSSCNIVLSVKVSILENFKLTLGKANKVHLQ